MADSIRYNTTDATKRTLYFPVIDPATGRFLSSSPTLAVGDAQVSIDGGAFANTATPVWEGNGFISIVLTQAQTLGQKLIVTVIDQDGPEWMDTSAIIYTGGHASAYFDGV